MNGKSMLITLISFLLFVATCALPMQFFAHESSQEKARPAPDRLDNSFVRLSSPQEIARYINEHDDDANLDDLWAKFGLDAESAKPGRCGCRGYDCPGTCKAEVLQMNSEGEQDKLSILRISNAGEAQCWYLIFNKESAWRVVGVVESLNNQHKPPEQRIVKHGTQRWLVIKELCGRGTGFVNYVERWYQLIRQAPREVLSYGASGHNVQGATSDYEFTSAVIEQGNEGEYRVVVQYTVLREPTYQPTFQWISSQKHQASFVWDSISEQFILDKANSDLPQSEESPIIRNLNRRVPDKLSYPKVPPVNKNVPNQSLDRSRRTIIRLNGNSRRRRGQLHRSVAMRSAGSVRMEWTRAEPGNLRSDKNEVHYTSTNTSGSRHTGRECQSGVG